MILTFRCWRRRLRFVDVGGMARSPELLALMMQADSCNRETICIIHAVARTLDYKHGDAEPISPTFEPSCG